MTRLNSTHEQQLTQFADLLIDQQQASVIVPPNDASTGFWFGGGNMIAGPDGELYVVGRYRNYGDSRTGLGVGDRGLELAIFQSCDHGASFEKVVSFAKSELAVDDKDVLSIEGSALRWTDSGVELFVSTEKSGIAYPDGLGDFLKPGTGVWTIERLVADSIAGLQDAAIRTIVRSSDPQYLHVKDPFAYNHPDGSMMLLFCTHPYCWSSSNTAYTTRSRDTDEIDANPNYDFFPRGTTWDVAMTRGTALLDIPKIGNFADLSVTLLFYDGGESLRNMDEHAAAVARPRGYSCEELGGLAYVVDGDFSNVYRLATIAPSFLSPWGTGCSRYVDVLTTNDGMYATWQQSQADLSQPLVMHFVTNEQIHAALR